MVGMVRGEMTEGTLLVEETIMIKGVEIKITTGVVVEETIEVGEIREMIETIIAEMIMVHLLEVVEMIPMMIIILGGLIAVEDNLL